MQEPALREDVVGPQSTFWINVNSLNEYLDRRHKTMQLVMVILNSKPVLYTVNNNRPPAAFWYCHFLTPTP
jgi:hypothetical protein